MNLTQSNESEGVWGLPGTVSWGLLIGFAIVYAQVIGIGLYIGIDNPGLDPANTDMDALLVQYQLHGIAISSGLILAAIVCLPLILGVIKLKKYSRIGSYLGIRGVPLKTFGFWVLAIFVAALAYDLLVWLLEKPIVPDFSLEVYRSAAGSWVMWLAIVLVAPLLEEVYFRGFLFKGLAASIAGPAGAITITALLWAAMHVQYDLLGIGFIFIVGLILGVARYQTGSTVLTFALHLLLNLGATIQTAYTVGSA